MFQHQLYQTAGRLKKNSRINLKSIRPLGKQPGSCDRHPSNSDTVATCGLQHVPAVLLIKNIAIAKNRYGNRLLYHSDILPPGRPGSPIRSDPRVKCQRICTRIFESSCQINGSPRLILPSGAKFDKKRNRNIFSNLGNNPGRQIRCV